MQRLTRRNNNCDVTVVTLPNGLQLRLRVWDKVPYKQCPVQIRAHHHTDVYTDINNYLGHPSTMCTQLIPSVDLQMFPSKNSEIGSKCFEAKKH